jgi:hypothetical protein
VHRRRPHRLLAAGHARLAQLIHTASRGLQGPERATQWLQAAQAALELYGDHPAVAFAELAAEVATEVRLLRGCQAELDHHASGREVCSRRVDPSALARSLPGLATVGGPALVATMGQASRFPTASRFRSFTGLTPRASETGQVDRKGQPISKAGNRLLRTTLIRAADTARRQDPQLARIYWTQMVERGNDHLGAVCVVAAHLAERAWSSWTENGPMWSATPTVSRSPPRRPRRSSPSAFPRLRRSASGGAARRGRPLNKSCKDMCMALKAQPGDPPPRRPLLDASLGASSQPDHGVDNPSSIENQPKSTPIPRPAPVMSQTRLSVMGPPSVTCTGVSARRSSSLSAIPLLVVLSTDRSHTLVFARAICGSEVAIRLSRRPARPGCGRDRG